MKLNKSLVALAVAGGLAIPAVAMADASVYGRVNLGLANVNDDGVATYGQDEGLGLQNVASRLGFRGDEDLGNGLNVYAHYEFGIDATSMTVQDNNRLAYVGVSGDFGDVQMGRVWSAWYDYIGWTVDRSWFWGGTGYYGYGGDDINVGATTRSSNTVKYTWGGGGYSTDPFTFSVEAVVDGQSAGGVADGAAIEDDDGDPTGEEADPQAIDTLTLAGQGTFDDFTVGLAHRLSNSNTSPSGAEPSQTAFSVRWAPAGPFYVGAVYNATDRDTDDNDSPSYFEVLGSMDFGDGLSGLLGVSSLDNDMDSDEGDTTGVFVQLNQALSGRTNMYAELQSLSIDGGDGDDTDPMILLLGLSHNF